MPRLHDHWVGDHSHCDPRWCGDSMATIEEAQMYDEEQYAIAEAESDPSWKVET